VSASGTESRFSISDSNILYCWKASLDRVNWKISCMSSMFLAWFTVISFLDESEYNSYDTNSLTLPFHISCHRETDVPF
jgi:hypothetical protein